MEACLELILDKHDTKVYTSQINKEGVKNSEAQFLYYYQ